MSSFSIQESDWWQSWFLEKKIENKKKKEKKRKIIGPFRKLKPDGNYFSESHLDAAKTISACVSVESLMVVLVVVVEGQPVQQRVENVFTLRFGRGWGWMGRWERVRGGERVRPCESTCAEREKNRWLWQNIIKALQGDDWLIAHIGHRQAGSRHSPIEKYIYTHGIDCGSRLFW